MTDADKTRLFYNQPAWKKSVIVLAGVFMNFILGWLLIAAVFMVGVPQTLVISATEADSPAAAAGISRGMSSRATPMRKASSIMWTRNKGTADHDHRHPQR